MCYLCKKSWMATYKTGEGGWSKTGRPVPPSPGPGLKPSLFTGLVRSSVRLCVVYLLQIENKKMQKTKLVRTAA